MFITVIHGSEYCKDLEGGLLKILSDKYGNDYVDMYKYAEIVLRKFAQQGRINKDEKDETFKLGLKSICGIIDDRLFHNFIYDSAMKFMEYNVNILKEFVKAEN